MDIEFDLFPELKAALEARRNQGDDVKDVTDPKRRTLGFLVGDDYLFIKMSNLSAQQLQAELQTPPIPHDLSDLWDTSPEKDMINLADVLTEGEREAAKARADLPSLEQMKEWVESIEQGIRRAGFDWNRRTYPGSPFTYSWGTSESRWHHGKLEFRTDHKGITVTVGDRDGAHIWTEITFARRVAWGDVDARPFDAWAEEQTTEAMIWYEKIPQCDCPDHQERRSGRWK